MRARRESRKLEDCWHTGFDRQKNPMTIAIPTYPDGNVEGIGNEVVLLRAGIKTNPMVGITRNMVIVRK